jgi:hypothetical protein
MFRSLQLENNFNVDASYSQGARRNGPPKLSVADVRFPPKSDIWDDLPRGRETEQRVAYLPDYSPTSPSSFRLASHSRGMMVLVDERAGSAAERAYAVVDEGSGGGRGGEALCEVPLRRGGEDPGAAGHIYDVREEPYISWPIQDERDRQVDMLRYLQALSSSPETDTALHMVGDGGARGADAQNTFASDFKKMYEDTGGPYVTHLASKRFGAALRESAEAVTSSRVLVVLTSQALHVVAKLRPADLLARTLRRPSGAEKTLEAMEGVFGQEELCAQLFSVAARLPPDLGYPIGRGLLIEPQPLPAIDRAQGYIKQWYNAPDPQAGNGLPTHVNALVTALGRVLRPVWYKPLVYDENPQVVPVATLFLQPPELRAIIAPLERLREVVAALHPRAVRVPSTGGVNRGADPHEEQVLARVQAAFFVIDRSLQVRGRRGGLSRALRAMLQPSVPTPPPTPSPLTFQPRCNSQPPPHRPSPRPCVCWSAWRASGGARASRACRWGPWQISPSWTWSPPLTATTASRPPWPTSCVPRAPLRTPPWTT